MRLAGLNLNVIVPAGSKPEAKLPVVVVRRRTSNCAVTGGADVSIAVVLWRCVQIHVIMMMRGTTGISGGYEYGSNAEYVCHSHV